MSNRVALRRRMLCGMRVLVEVRDEQSNFLQELAQDGHRSIREQAGYLLHLKINEEYARLKQAAPVPTESAA